MGLVLIPRRVELGLLLAGLLAAALMPTLPHVPLCFYHAVTGSDCPGCGTTRAVFAILHGRFAAAADFNLLGYFVMLIVLRRIVTLARPETATSWFNSPRADKLLMGSMIAVAAVQYAYKLLR
jgi:hypothetical protein